MEKQILYINGRFLTQKLTGVQRFAKEILQEYFKLNKAHTAIIVAPPDCRITHLYGCEIKRIGYNSNHIWEQIDLPLFLKMNNSPILLNLTNTAPLFYKRNIITIHDLAFLVNPKWFSYFFRTFYKFLIPKIAQNALHIITVSNTIKHQLIEILNIRKEKISVAYNAVSSNFKLPLKNNSFNNRYALTVCSLDPRKNLVSLIKAFYAAKLTNLNLYVIGEKNPNFKFDYRIFDSENIKFIGRVNDNTLVDYYANADFFINISLYEGFGIPNLEAMKFGIPVITSDIPVMKEICKDAALFTDPNNIEDIKNKIILLNNNNKLKKDLIKQGYINLTNYSWRASAEILKKTIEKEIS